MQAREFQWCVESAARSVCSRAHRAPTSEHRFGQFLRYIIIPAAILLLPAFSYADAVQYSYDQLGRVIEAANSTSGQATQYSYDAAGNITAIKTVAVGTVSIAGFSPTQGTAATSVTISGTGFDATTPANNTVKFNTAAAVVVSATATQIVATVPSGATTGPVSVTKASVTATSTGNFIVVASNAPHITNFSPTVGAAGTAVTITGTNFQPPVGDRVQFNQYQAVVSAATATGISTAVPANSSSGKIQVTTQYGTAISAADFIIPPPGFAAASIGTSGRVPPNATATTVTLTTASKIAVELFDGVTGQYFTLGLSNDTIAGATVTILNPDGSQLLSATVTPSNPAIQLPRLPDTGTYTIVIDPGANTGSVTMTLALPLTGTLSAGGAALPLAISPAGRRALVTFGGSAGQYITLTASAVTLPAGTLSILNPDGTMLISRSITSSGGALLPRLPLAGTYTVLVNPTGAVSGNITLALVTTAASTLHVNPASYDTLTITDSSPHSLSFNASPGQIFTLAVCWCTTQTRPATLQILAPDGSVLASAVPGTFTSIPLGSIPMSGTYSVVVQIPGNAASVPFNFSLTTPVTATLPINAPFSVSTTSPAQGIRLSFSGMAGQNFSLGTQENCSNFLNPATITLFKPDGSIALAGFFKADSGCTSGDSGTGLLYLGPLPSSGIYFVEIEAGAFFDQGTLTFDLYDWSSSNWATGLLTVNGSPTSDSLTQPQPGAKLTFTGGANQSLKLSIQETANLTNPNIQIFAPDGTQYQGYFINGSSCTSPCAGLQTVFFDPLSLAGTYTVLVTPAVSTYGSGSWIFQLNTQ